jgi:FixJ family two-component response regulator
MNALFLVASALSVGPIARRAVTGYALRQMQTQQDVSATAAPMIAIVDDDKGVRDALQRMLRSHGFAAIVYDSAEHFLTEAGPDHVACLIADVRMPGMTGIALHDHLTSRGVRLPTILITARPSSGERQRAIALGAASYLAKPLTEQILLDTVREALVNSAAMPDASFPPAGSSRV